MALVMSTYVNITSFIRSGSADGSSQSPTVTSGVVDCFGLSSLVETWIKKAWQTVLTITTDIRWRYKALFTAASQDPYPSISFVLLHDAQQLSLCDGYGALAAGWKKNTSVVHVSKNISFWTSWACVWPKCTIKVVENGALAEGGGLYVVKLVIKLCAQVACLVRCYATENNI